MSAKSSSGRNSSARSCRRAAMSTSLKEAPVPVALPFRRAGFRGLPASFFMRISFVRRIGGSETNSPTQGRKLRRQAVHNLRNAQGAGLRTAPLVEAIHAALSLGASAREAIRRRLRAKIAEAYSVERMTRDTLSVYAEALSR
jgi:glycosyltransferase involved in cell wall biosynthesis